ncbi:MAG: YggS family pyridoxal phosphate-dependent enzyme [Actinobacteria bacterium]|nr:YggS family pyridoxal phosphate-dependent enzyme [Actinomycetota bacterium]
MTEPVDGPSSTTAGTTDPGIESIPAGSARFPMCRSRAELEANVAEVRARIAAAAARVDRNPADIRLLPVTKTMGDEPISWLAGTGVTLVGENKAQEARSKRELFDRLGFAWAMIGHLQTNKVNQVVGSATEVHSLDRLELAEKLDRRLQTLGESLDVYIQVNSSGEASKYGLEPAEVFGFAEAIRSMDTLHVRGLMTLAVFSADAAAVNRCFTTMTDLQERLRQDAHGPERFAELSMGMSGDFELAIEHGATTVRVGQRLFGARDLGPDHYWPGLAAKN